MHKRIVARVPDRSPVDLSFSDVYSIRVEVSTIYSEYDIYSSLSIRFLSDKSSHSATQLTTRSSVLVAVFCFIRRRGQHLTETRGRSQALDLYLYKTYIY